MKKLLPVLFLFLSFSSNAQVIHNYYQLDTVIAHFLANPGVPLPVANRNTLQWDTTLIRLITTTPSPSDSVHLADSMAVVRDSIAALRADIMPQNLQSVTNVGNSTTNKLIVTSATLGNEVIIDTNLIETHKTIGLTDYIGKLLTSRITANRNDTLPDKSGTIALTTDIPDTIWIHNYAFLKPDSNTHGNAVTLDYAATNFVPYTDTSHWLNNAGFGLIKSSQLVYVDTTKIPTFSDTLHAAPLLTTPTWVDSAIAANQAGYVNYFFDTTHQSGYRTLTPIYTYTTQTLSYTGVINNENLDSFITNPNSPAQNNLRGGDYIFHIHATQTSGTKTSQLYYKFYTVDTNGVATLQMTTGNSSVLTNVEAEYTQNINLPNDVLINTKDRFLVKIFAAISGGGSAPSITLKMMDNTDARVSAPAPGVSVDKFVPYINGLYSLDLTGHNITTDTLFGKISSSYIYPTPTTGTVTSVNAAVSSVTASDITVSVLSPTTTPTVIINIPTASGTQRGALSSTDWTTFNGKQPAMSGTGYSKFSGSSVSYNATIPFTDLPAVVDSGTLVFGASGLGGVVSTSTTISLRVNYACTLIWWQIDGDQSGSCVIDIKRSGTSLIGGGNAPTLSSTQTAAQTISGWTSTSISKGDLLVLSITSLTTLTWFNLYLYVVKS